MRHHHLPQLPRSRRLGQLLAVVGLALVAIWLTALPAAAHHPLINAQADCDGNVTFTSTAWNSSSASARANSSILIQAQLNGTWTQVGSGSYTAGNSYSFGGSFTEPRSAFPFQLRAYAAAPWGDNAQGGSFSTTTVAARSGCDQPPVATAPTLSVSHTCSTYTVTVDNTATGTTTAPYTVKQDNTVKHNGTVAAGQQGTWTSGTLTPGSYTVDVTSGATTKHVDVTIPRCTQPTPPASTTPTAAVVHGCSTYTVTVTNPGGAATSFTVKQDDAVVHTGGVAAHDQTTWTSTTLAQGNHAVVVTSPASGHSLLDTTVAIPGCSTPPTPPTTPPAVGTPAADIVVSCQGYDISVVNTGGGTTAVPFQVSVNQVTTTVSASSTPQHVTGAVTSSTGNVYSVSQGGTPLVTKTFNGSTCAVISPPASIPTVAPSALIRANCTGFLTVLDNSASTVATTFVVTTNAGRPSAEQHPVKVPAGKSVTPAKWPIKTGVAQTVTVTAPQMQKVTRSFTRGDCAHVSAPTSSSTTSATSTSTSTNTSGAQVSAPSAPLPKTGNQLSPLMLWAGSLMLLGGLTMMRRRRTA